MDTFRGRNCANSCPVRGDTGTSGAPPVLPRVSAGGAYSDAMSSREELPRFVDPMLARTGPPPIDDRWAVEVKFDGMRLQLRRDGHAVCLRSRPGRDCSEEVPELTAIASALGRHRVLLDGELVCLEGRRRSRLRPLPPAAARPGRQGAST
jgi:ATP-dependent DNA ligase